MSEPRNFMIKSFTITMEDGQEIVIEADGPIQVSVDIDMSLSEKLPFGFQRPTSRAPQQAFVTMILKGRVKNMTSSINRLHSIVEDHKTAPAYLRLPEGDIPKSEIDQISKTESSEFGA